MSRPDDTAFIFHESLGYLQAEAPSAYRALCDALCGRAVAVLIDGDDFTLSSDGREAWIAGPLAGATARIEATVDAVLAIVDGRRTLLDAILEGDIAVHAALEDAIRLDDALRAYVHGAVVAPSCAGLRTRLAEAGKTHFEARRSEQPASVLIHTSNG